MLAAFSRAGRRYAFFTLCLALVVVLIVLPLALLVAHGFGSSDRTGWNWTLEFVREVTTGTKYWQALTNTVIVGILATLLATGIGVPLAWIFARTNVPAATLLERLATIPIFIPPFVGAFAWVLLAAPRVGVFNIAALWLGIKDPFNVYVLGGISWVIGIYLAPYVMMIVAGALRSMDPSLEEAGQIGGLSRLRTATRITLPLVAPAILSGAVLAFVIAIGLFGTPLVLGWARQVLFVTSRIYVASMEVPPGYGVMAVLALYLIVLSLIAMALQRWLLRGRSYITVTGKGFRTRILKLGWSRYVLALGIWLYVFVTIIAPIVVLAVAAASSYTWSGKWSPQYLLFLWESQDVHVTLINSLVISVLSATLATLFGLAIAWINCRTRLRGRQILEYIVLMPIAVPGIAFGVGVVLLWLKLPVAVYGTLWIIVLALVGRFSAYAVRSISASLVQVHPELEESARISGYGWLKTLSFVTLPLIRPSIIASWMLLYSIFFTELSMVILLYTAETRTFSILSFEVWNQGNFSHVASLSLLQLAVGVTIMCIVQILWRQRQVRS